MSKKIFFLILIDQITKLIFSTRDFFIGTFHFHLVKNTGLAFSLNFSLLPNLILVTLGLAYFAFYYFRRRLHVSFLGELMFVFIFAGAISNLIDRVYLGYVRDFIDFGWGFTFNLADVFVVIGILMVIYLQDGDKYIN
jgi:signal peptidase II